MKPFKAWVATVDTVPEKTRIVVGCESLAVSVKTILAEHGHCVEVEHTWMPERSKEEYLRSLRLLDLLLAERPADGRLQ